MNHTVLALGCLYKTHLWQFLESRWFGLASIPSSVSFECLLHNVSWLESLQSWSSSREDFESSEWRWIVSCVSHCSEKKNARLKQLAFTLAHSSKVQSIMVGKALQMFHCVCGQKHSARKSGAQPTPSLIHGPVPPTFRVGPLAPVNLI